MRTLILTNILSSNSVYKLNSYIKKNKRELGEVFVFFCGATEKNRRWELHEKPNFLYKILPNKKIEIGNKDLFTFFINYSIWTELNGFKPNRIIICGWNQIAYLTAWIWGMVHKSEITIWSESTIYEKSIWRVLTKPLIKLIIKTSNNFIASGIRSKEYLFSLGADTKKVSVFMDDVNKDYFVEKSKELRSSKKRIKVSKHITTQHNFLFVGQLIERKGVLNLIKSYIIFKSVNPDWGLIIVGYGKQEKFLKRYVREAGIKDIYFLGAIEQYGLPRIYVASDCLVLPSTEEVWGLVVNEALYCGLKVLVSSNCGCAPDLVKESVNGFTFDPYNNVSLLDGMIKVANKIDKKPFFSIVTCTFNSAKYLPENIRSVSNQTFKNYEHLFIDGYSKDGTELVIKKYKNMFPESVRFYKRQPNGISDAMNGGIEKGNGKYIIFLHSDDSLLDKNVLREIYMYLISNKLPDWISGKVRVIEESRDVIGIFPNRAIYNFLPKYFLKFYNLVPHQAVFMKSSTFKKYGMFDVKISSLMDVDLWMRIWNKTNWKYCKRIISNYMIRRNSQSSNINNQAENVLNLKKVRARYLNRFEKIISNLVIAITDRYNNTLR